MRETSSLLFCNTPHGEAVRAVAVVRRVHVTIVEVQGVPVRTVRRARPVVAVVAHVVQLPIAVVAIPRSRDKAVSLMNVSADESMSEHKYSLVFIARLFLHTNQYFYKHKLADC